VDSFIVRVYRRIKTTDELIGTVEDVARHCTEPFRTFKELRKALNRAVPDDPREPQAPAPARRRKK
jgi:hypothetical protein